MKNLMISLLLLTMFSVQLFAQPDLFSHDKKIAKKQKDYNKLQKGWNLGLNSAFTVTQTAYKDWSPGGSNVFVWTSTLNGTAIYDTTHWNWANESQIVYGYSKQNGEVSRKTNDLIDFESVVTFKKKQYLNPYLSLNFRTQMAPGYKYKDKTKSKISDFFDPAFLTNGLGIGYSPTKMFRTRLGLASQTVFTNKYTDYADGDKIQIDSGLQWVTHAERKLWESLLIRSRLQLFSSFDNIKGGNITWDTLMQASITKYIVVNLQAFMVYDRRVSLRAQFKEVLSIGLRYDFI